MLSLDLLIVCNLSVCLPIQMQAVAYKFNLNLFHFFICKIFTAYNYFVLSQTKEASLAGGQGSVLWVEYVSLTSKNKVAH